LYKDYNTREPFFELGPKAYLYGRASLELAIQADMISKKYNIHIIYTPQYTDIEKIANATEYIDVFSQHMDALEIGRGIGSVLPEAIKSAGAAGALLNHAEKKMTLSDISKAIKRADEIGLATMVCADNLAEVLAVAQLGPNIILAEPESQIGVQAKSDDNIKNNCEYIKKVKKKVKDINPLIKILFSTEIYSGNDVYNIICSGAEGTGCTSGVIKADNPTEKLDEMIFSMQKAWNDLNEGKCRPL